MQQCNILNITKGVYTWLCKVKGLWKVQWKETKQINHDFTLEGWKMAACATIRKLYHFLKWSQKKSGGELVLQNVTEWKKTQKHINSILSYLSYRFSSLSKTEPPVVLVCSWPPCDCPCEDQNDIIFTAWPPSLFTIICVSGMSSKPSAHCALRVCVCLFITLLLRYSQLVWFGGGGRQTGDLALTSLIRDFVHLNSWT